MTEPKKMTAAEYLTARGWAEEEDSGRWYDTVDGAATCDRADALTIQRARDAAKEAAAWVAFAAGAIAAPDNEAQSSLAIGDADDLLAAYRTRFAVEVEP